MAIDIIDEFRRVVNDDSLQIINFTSVNGIIFSLNEFSQLNFDKNTELITGYLLHFPQGQKIPLKRYFRMSFSNIEQFFYIDKSEIDRLGYEVVKNASLLQ